MIIMNFVADLVSQNITNQFSAKSKGNTVLVHYAAAVVWLIYSKLSVPIM